jgi:NADH:ubiquinone oxidoreductase subunit F (NADH-binding)/NADH:ubiquinone oxidoreductase subunit E
MHRSARRHTPAFPKGRQPDPEAGDEIRALLGDRPREREHLIEHLHLIQDRYGCLSVAHLQALAIEMRLAMAEVYEVASFYAHFDVVLDGQVPPAPVTVRVCDGLSCALAGAEDLFAGLSATPGPDVRIVRAPCMGRCDTAPVATVGQCAVDHADGDAIVTAVRAGDFRPAIPEHTRLPAYVRDAGYRTLRECYAGERSAADIVATMEDSALRGLGGAGFPAGRKWGFVRSEPAPRLMAVNADEGEPGTFKDRYHLERDPHRFLEGMLIAAWAVEAEAIYIYLRDEYPAVREILGEAIAEAVGEDLNGGRPIHLRRGAGAYICGEESAMLESIEGKRGLPRHKPPFPSEAGLFGRPTLVHNVETLFWVRDILERGPAWFAEGGRNDREGRRSFSVSGRVREPGVKFAPAGITARQLIDEYCGGMAEGHELKAYLPGGASGGIFPARMADIPLDFGTLEEHGGFVGSGAVIVLSQADSIRDAALNLMRFFEDESCGQCTPCRVGTEKAVNLMSERDWDPDLLHELSDTMAAASICGLGQAAPNPLLCLMKYFPEELP